MKYKKTETQSKKPQVLQNLVAEPGLEPLGTRASPFQAGHGSPGLLWRRPQGFLLGV